MSRHASFVTRGTFAKDGQNARAPEPQQEQCDFCSEPIPPEHRHLLEVASRQVLCVCRPCSILFDKEGAAEGRYKVIPDRVLRLQEFRMDEVQWERLRIPVNLAFFFYSTPAGRVQAFYPSPMGPTESLLELETWCELESANPALAGMAADVEALLVNRTHGSEGYYLVPIDECFRLVGLIRMNWRGLSGGTELWRAVDGFFEDLSARARTEAPRK